MENIFSRTKILAIPKGKKDFYHFRRSIQPKIKWSPPELGQSTYFKNLEEFKNTYLCTEKSSDRTTMTDNTPDSYLTTLDPTVLIQILLVSQNGVTSKSSSERSTKNYTLSTANDGITLGLKAKSSDILPTTRNILHKFRKWLTYKIDENVTSSTTFWDNISLKVKNTIVRYTPRECELENVTRHFFDRFKAEPRINNGGDDGTILTNNSSIIEDSVEDQQNTIHACFNHQDLDSAFKSWLGVVPTTTDTNKIRKRIIRKNRTKIFRKKKKSPLSKF